MCEAITNIETSGDIDEGIARVDKALEQLAAFNAPVALALYL